MNFKFKDLEINLPVPEEGETHAWFAFVGCGPKSGGCSDTQPFEPRTEPIDILYGANSKDELRALRKALKRVLGHINTLVDPGGAPGPEADDGNETA